MSDSLSTDDRISVEITHELTADIRGSVAEFRRNRRETYPHTAVDLLLDAIDDASGLIDEVLARVPVWQPIETAPMDGREVLVCNLGCVRVGFRDIARGGVWSLWPGREAARPTHWMPLPAAPKVEVPA